jgi:predicted extracellular nuclease
LKIDLKQSLTIHLPPKLTDMKNIYLLISLILFCSFLNAQTTVFSDNFSTNTNSTYTTTGAIGATPWSVLVQNADWGARRNTSPEQLELTNDASAAANANGWTLASTPTASFLSPYNSTLSLNSNIITWTFNMRQIRPDPSGMASGSYGVAYILAGTANTTRTTGTGYAVTLGQSGVTDAVRLIQYSAGLGTSTNIITSNTAGLIDFGAEYLSVRISYTPSTNTWELLLRNDGITAFTDPATGTLISQGTAVENTYTGIPLDIMGAFWNGSTAAAQTAFFDNVSVSIATAAGPTVSIASGTNATEGGSNGSFTINFSPATTGITTLDYSLPVAGNATFTTDYSAGLTSTPAAGVTPASVSATTGTITVPAGVLSVTVTITPVDDALSEGPEPVVMTLSNPLAPYTLGNASSSITIIDNESSPIHSIQGAGAAAIAGTFTAEAIVTGIYPTLSPAGFYIQEENTDADADPNTSEGIFIVSTTPVAVGDLVRVTGTVQENAATPSFNQAVFSSPTVTVLSSGNPLPTAVDISLPVTTTADFEKYEGMIVRFPGTLTVSNNDALGTFGEARLSAGGLVYQPTQLIDPNDSPASGTSSTGTSNIAAVNALIASNSLRTILLDDGRGTLPTLPPYIDANNTLRVGSTIDNLTGILGFGFSNYRVQPISTAPPFFIHAARPGVPGVGGGNLKVASFNVLNYFNGDGLGGGFPTARGANSLAEFNRQRDKITNAISQLNADLVGLIEIENDGTGANSAIQDLVNGLNAAMGAGTYSFINDGASIQTNSSDAIRCAIIYKSAIVTPVGSPMLSSNVIFDRPPLAHTFNMIATNKQFNFIVNHFKSKGCGSATGADLDQNDGQACYNNRRKLQATELINFINTTVTATSGTDRIITVGDYNAYYEEDPIDILRANNFTVLSAAAEYSFLFSGQVGALDHALVSGSLLTAVTGIGKWNANSAEPEYLDYNDAVNDGGSDVVNNWASTYTVSPWRSSDHDAVIIGFNISATLPVSLADFTVVKDGNKSKLKWTTTQETNTKEFIIERSANGINYQPIGAVKAAGNSTTAVYYNAVDINPAKGVNQYRLKMIDIDGKPEYSAVRRVNFDNNNLYSFYPNPAKNLINIAVDNANRLVVDAEIYNMQSQLLMKRKINIASQITPVDISSLSSGIYLLKIIANDGTATMQKFIKQ